MHDRRGIRARRGEGGTIRGMAREFGASRNAVRRALDPKSNLDYQRPTLADEYEAAVRDVLADYPRMQVPQIAALIDWPGGRSTLSELVARLRPLALEREREDLGRPRLGAVTAGTIKLGTVTAGRMTVGRVQHGNSSHSVRHPRDAA